MLAPWKKSYDKPRQHVKKQTHYFVNKGLYSRSYDFSRSHVQIWELDHKKGWVQKDWCFWTVVLEKTLESPLDCKEIKPVNPKGNQSWIFVGRTDAEATILWSPDAKSRLIRIDPDTGKDWRQEEKGTTEDEMVGWHHQLNGHEFEQALGAGDRQGSLACCSPWGHKESDTTDQQQISPKALQDMNQTVLYLDTLVSSNTVERSSEPNSGLNLGFLERTAVNKKQESPVISDIQRVCMGESGRIRWREKPHYRYMNLTQQEIKTSRSSPIDTTEQKSIQILSRACSYG